MSESDSPPLPRIKLINYLTFHNFPLAAVALRGDNTFIFPSISFYFGIVIEFYLINLETYTIKKWSYLSLILIYIMLSLIK